MNPSDQTGENDVPDPITWTVEQRKQMRDRAVKALSEFIDSPRSCQILQQIAHRGPCAALVFGLHQGMSAKCSGDLVSRITQAACDVVLTQLINERPDDMAYQLTDQAVTEESSNWNARQRREVEVVNGGT